ncbi:hypothetical protein FB45DRAFT_915234 [Roridomyces roridus]|uniref:FAD/NAD(P)-binding domain-containing protein n=1 Tax=Roridomyces roridus TaxID=1738132 RepID=A0AAD7BT81_9AGAR|nr:hypothetical protein FB45DRAFT_915234 [Roridomyces roridus]
MTRTTNNTFFAGLACVAAVCVLLLWQKICKSRPSWIQNLDSLGRTRAAKLPGNAVVCGGSVAGIVTARILADHFEHVYLVDPEIGDMDKPKTRILQYHAGHVFLGLFVQGARRLWPNFDVELAAAGARFVPADLQVHFSGVLLLTPYHDYPPGCLPDTLVTRRSTAQVALEKVLTQHPTSANITMVAGTVRSIRLLDGKTSIESVLVRKSDGTQMSLGDVGLVADCTGATQAGLKWLESAGISLPRSLRACYTANLAYVTICFTVAPKLEEMLSLPEWTKKTTALYAYSNSSSSVLALIKTDNGTMQFLCGDAGSFDLPRTSADVIPFLARMQGKADMPSWFISTMSILCERGNPSFNNIRIPTQSYVQYHSLPEAKLPSNFVAIGDANLQLNPMHAQGFAKIMLNALVLNALLNTVKLDATELPRDFSKRYFKANALNTQGLWDATRFHDYGSPNCQPVEGETTENGRFARWFGFKLISAATKDEEVASALWHVRHMFAADKALFAPRILWKVLWTRSLF